MYTLFNNVVSLYNLEVLASMNNKMEMVKSI